ncbi:class I SAM-dependent methyltransferase [Xanthovirga aplysinae]|uniref:class I SAM-dependent methyltransferase n=1 Tax=Xanthovirga aplysinae TaxID=2529853 RepID=UPI0012BCA613|nr:class I SAM-dependent methyltransferase [Xanthovirga aplysinae]MTI33649.1 hypothetical protein [Xanthovirga aplysinae]
MSEFFNQVLRKEVKEFIRDHLKDDPVNLMLQVNKYPDIPMKMVVEQIQARQKARNKLPEWAANDGLIFPPSLSMEQCSSEITAHFKASLVSGKRLIDLTGGAGVDVYYFSKVFDQVDYVERQKELAAITNHNMQQLQATNVRLHHEQAEKFLEALKEKVDVIYLDPARRGKHQEKVFFISDCEPDVGKMGADLLEKAEKVLVKTSPMLDISQAIRDLGNVEKVFVVAVDNECKEVLYLLSKKEKRTPTIETINFGRSSKQYLIFDPQEEIHVEVSYGNPATYIYEPNVAILKAGAFKVLTKSFGVNKLNPNSHLYTSESLVPDFPGRIFKCESQCSYSKKEILRHLPQKKANITVRNFPATVKEIRKKTGIKEGGDTYILATTDLNNKHLLLICKKVSF